MGMGMEVIGIDIDVEAKLRAGSGGPVVIGMDVMGIDMEAKLLAGGSEFPDMNVVGIDIAEGDIWDFVSESIMKPDRK